MSCLHCRHWLLKQSGAIAVQRFARCHHQPPWAYFPPLHQCERFEVLDADKLAARLAWEAK